MKTINKVGGVNGLSYTEFYGISTDIKPTDDTISNGSVFYEIDHNMQEYRWDKENSIWRKISSVTSVTTGGGTPTIGDYLPLSGGTMQGAIDMSGYQVENASELTLGETGYVGIIPHETTSETDNGTTVELSNPKTKKDIKLRGIDTPTNDNDTVNKKYADNIKEYGIEHSPVLDSGQEEFVLGQNDLAYVFKNSMVMDSGDRFYFADPVSLTDGRLVPFITSAMTGEEYHLLVGTYPKGVQDGTLAPVQIDGIATPTGDNMAVNKKYVDDLVGQGSGASGEYIPLSGTESGKPVTGDIVFDNQHSITGLPTPTVDGSAATKKYVDDNLSNFYKIDGSVPMNKCTLKDIDGSEHTGKIEYVREEINGNVFHTFFVSGTKGETPELVNLYGLITLNMPSLDAFEAMNKPQAVSIGTLQNFYSHLSEKYLPIKNNVNDKTYTVEGQDYSVVLNESSSGRTLKIQHNLYPDKQYSFITSKGINWYREYTGNSYPMGSIVYEGNKRFKIGEDWVHMNSIKLGGIDAPVNYNDAANKQYVDDTVKSITENQVTIQKADNENMCINLTVDGDEASGILDLTDKNGNPVIVRGVDTPVQDTDAVNKKYFETHLSTDFIPTKDLDMKQYKLINTSAVEIYGGINDSANNTYFIRETSQASINTDTKVPEYVKVITGVHTGDTNQDVILRGIRAGQQKNDAVNYNQFKTLADSFERCQHDVESLNAWKMTFDENQVANTVNSIIKYTDVAYELTIASGEEQWYSYDLAMQSGYTPISATLVIDDTNPFVGHCSLDITPDGTYNALIYLKSQGDDKTCNCKVRLVWIKNQ